MSGPPRKVDAEEAFERWYNGGQRRTLAAIAADMEVGYSTLRRYADDDEWEIRAAELDAKIQKETDARVAAMVGRQRARVMEALATVQGRFFMRLPDTIKDPASGELIPNPAYLSPGDLTVADFERLVKLFELMAGNPTFRLALGDGTGVDDDTAAGLEEMERRIIEMELATAGVLPASTEGGSDGD